MGVGESLPGATALSAARSVSSILLTTRDKAFDRLARECSLGSDTLPGEIAEMRLRFGRLKSEGLTEYAAFGAEGTVNRLRKGPLVL